MRVYVQGFSALAHYRSGEARIDVERPSRKLLKLDEATASITHIREMRIYRLGIGDPSPENPLEVLVPRSDLRGNSNAVRARVWSRAISGNAFRAIDREIYVSSPEFVFLQLATRVSFVQLVSLGMELCGTYRRRVRVPVLGTDEYEYVTEFQTPVLTTPRRISGFLNSMKSAPGLKTAKKALEYVLPNSASPMETAVYLLLCLPRRLGGYALPKPVLNPSITFSASGRRFTLKKSAKPDLFWKQKRLDLEHDGGKWHGEDRRSVDSMRRKALEHANVEVIELTKEEVYSESMFHATALRIARKLGKSIRPEHEGDFVERRAELRSEVLYEDVRTADEHDDKTDSRDGHAPTLSSFEPQDIDDYPFEEEWVGSSPADGFEDWDLSDWSVSFSQNIQADDGDGMKTYGAGVFEEE